MKEDTVHITNEAIWAVETELNTWPTEAVPSFTAVGGKREAVRRILNVASPHLVLARPAPTREQIAQALHDDTEVHAWLSESCIDHGCGQTYDRSAAVVLALLNGSES